VDERDECRRKRCMWMKDINVSKFIQNVITKTHKFITYKLTSTTPTLTKIKLLKINKLNILY